MSESKYFLSWEEFDNAVYSIMREVKVQEDPDLVVGVGRGGFPGATMISHGLDVPMDTIFATHYDGENRNQGVKVESEGLIQVEDGDNVLLFDEVVDTGRTMEAITKKWDRQGVVDFDYSTAAIHIKPDSGFTPDYWLEEIDQWTVYPWEVSL
jgi:hypoxanthine phosphoribosyltransferase